MRDINQTFLTGRLKDDVRTFQTHDFKNGAEFTLAVHDEWRDNDGKLQNRTDYIGVICYGHLTTTATLLRKGDSVIVTGKMRNEDVPKPGGGTESKTKLRALTVATHREIKPA